MAEPESPENLYEEANELLMNDQLEDAIKIYTKCLDPTQSGNSAILFNCYLGRCSALLKSHRPKEALEDADCSIKLKPLDSRGYVKKGIALFHLRLFKEAKEVLDEGLQLATNESESKQKQCIDWIAKCVKEIPAEEKPKVKSEEAMTSKNVLQVTAVPPAPAAFKHEWYQTESHVIVTLLAKNVTADDVIVTVNAKELKIESKQPDTLKLKFDFELMHQIVPDQAIIKHMATKIEIKLKKAEAIHWSKLEADKSVAKSVKSNSAKNWDKIVAEETKDDKETGDNALNSLFSQVYSNGSDEVRRAMNKSFTESGGTVLSTNWQDIGAKKVDVKPPDGLEWKKWDD